MKTCSIGGCVNSHKAKGLCNKHYRRLMKHGDVHTVKPRAGQPPTVHPGDVYGRLTVVEEADSRRGRQDRFYLCRCECGNESTVAGYALRGGNTRSCGCLKIERIKVIRTTHGTTANGMRPKRGSAYYSWAGLKGRCSNPKSASYPYYGARGIKVCERWEGRDGFQNFLTDMGERPSGMTLDRIDVDGDYEPSNCRWATRAEQAQNKQSHATIKRLETIVGEQAEIIETLRQELGI